MTAMYQLGLSHICSLWRVSQDSNTQSEILQKLNNVLYSAMLTDTCGVWLLYHVYYIANSVVVHILIFSAAADLRYQASNCPICRFREWTNIVHVMYMWCTCNHCVYIIIDTCTCCGCDIYVALLDIIKVAYYHYSKKPLLNVKAHTCRCLGGDDFKLLMN